MSADAGSYALENAKQKGKRLDWKESLHEEWRLMAIDCNCRSKSAWSLNQCSMAWGKDCAYENCEFVRRNTVC